jgi:hypothetical protein
MFFDSVYKIKNKILITITIFCALPAILITGTLPARLQKPTPQPNPYEPSTVSDGYDIYLPVISRLVNTDLSVNNLEITQAVQDTNNSVPLVAGRATVLRIYPHTNTTDPVQGVSVSVSATRNGQPLAYSPQTAGPGTVVVNPRRSDINSSFNLRLPADWLSGVVTLQVTIDPSNAIEEKDETNNTYTTTLTFNSVPPLNVTIVPINYFDTMYGYYYPAPTQSESQYIYSSLMQMYPVSGVNITWHSNYPNNNWFDGQLEFTPAWDTLLNRILALMISENAPATQVYWGLIPVENSSGKTWVGGATMQGYSQPGTRGGIGLASYPHFSNGGVLIAHEVGHMLGLWHAPCGANNHIDPYFPYKDGSIGQYGLDVTDLTQFHLVPNTYHDMMSYCQPAWVSDYSYKKLYDGQRAQLLSNRSTTEEDSLLIRALTGENGDFKLEPVYSFKGLPEQSGNESRFLVEFLNDAGEVVGQSTLPVPDSSDPETPVHSFTVLIEKPAYPFAALRIIQNGEELAERSLGQPSANPVAKPEVLQLKDGVLLRWGAASTPALIRYTSDQGNTWTTLALDWLGGELFIDPGTMPSGAIQIEITLADSTASTLSTTWENIHP